MNIALVVYCLRGGGAERVTSYLANYLAGRGHAVTVVTELAADTDQWRLDRRIAREVIGAGQGGGKLRKAWRMARKVWALRRSLTRQRHDVAVSFMTEAITWRCWLLGE